jgi:Spy/CpxP family protein refolding chaperone
MIDQRLEPSIPTKCGGRVMRTRTIVIIALTIGLAAMAAGTWAVQSTPQHIGKFFSDTPMKRLIMGKIGRMLVLRSELNVTAEQKKKFKEILVNHKGELAPLARTVVDKRHALRDAILAEHPKEAAIRAAAKDLSKTIEEASMMASKLISEARPLLTSRQRESIQRFMAGNDKAVNEWLTEISK